MKRWCAMVPAIVCAIWPWGAPARGGPASRSADAGGDLGDGIRRYVDQHTAAVLSRPPEEHVPARTALLGLERAYVGALLARADDPDVEVRLRVREALRRAGTETRIARAVANLAGDQREKLRRFRLAQPELFAKLFSDDWPARVQAIWRIASLEDRDALAEPLVVMCVRHPAVEFRLAAARAAASGRYSSAAMVDALTALVMREEESHSWFLADEESRDPWSYAIEALRKLHSKRAAPGLFVALTRMGVYDARRQAALAQTLAATGELRLVPLLMERLARTSTSYQHTVPGVGKVTVAASDPALLALSKLTDQSPGSYGLIFREDDRGMLALGFPDSRTRKAAVEKFRAWWAANKASPRYKGLTPLELPMWPAVTTRSAAAPPRPADGGRPAAATQPGRQEDLERRLGGEVARLVTKLRAERYADRQAGEDEIVALHQQLVDCVARRAEPAAGARPGEAAVPEARRLVSGILGEMIVEIRIASMLAEQPAERREQLVRLRHSAGATFDDLFSLSWSRQAAAVMRIANTRGEPEAAEALLVRAIRHPSDEVSASALRAVRQGRLRSDAIVDALGRLVADKLTRRGSRSPYGDPRASGGPFAEAIKTLKELGSPRFAPLALALLKASQNQSEIRQALAVAVGRSGEKRAIPVLLEMLDEKGWESTWTSGKMTLTIRPGDAPLMALLHLTGQDPKNYQFIHWQWDNQFGDRTYGFKDDKTREAAVRKFRLWWAVKKDGEPYKGLEPLAPSELRSEDDQEEEP